MKLAVENKADNFRNTLLRRIECGYYEPGMQLPSERDLTEIYHVSRTTVRTALEELEKEQVLTRNIGKGTFVSQQVHRIIIDLARETTATVGFILTLDRYYNPVIREVFMYFCEALAPELMPRICFFNCLGADRLREMNPDFIVIDDYFGDNILSGLDEFADKMLMLGSRCKKFNYIGVDNFDGGRQMAEYLIGMGHRNIGVITADIENPKSEMSRRLAGINLACKQAGIRPASVFDARYKNTAEYYKLALEHLVKTTPDMTALICHSDFSATCAFTGLREMGLSIPDDISLVGFDDQMYDRYFDPAMTTVRQPLGRLGDELAITINRALKGEKIDIKKELKPVLIERLSVKKLS